jgi:hypothetical protein
MLNNLGAQASAPRRRMRWRPRGIELKITVERSVKTFFQVLSNACSSVGHRMQTHHLHHMTVAVSRPRNANSICRDVTSNTAAHTATPIKTQVATTNDHDSAISKGCVSV